MPESSIRPYKPDDLDVVLDVWLGASRLAHPFLDEAFLERERREIAEAHLPNAETWVYEQEGAVVGFVALAGDEVGGLFVDPSRHGQGIGRALMDHTRTLRTVLHLDVFEENRIGRAFYDRYGFTIVGEHVHEPTGRRQLRMRLDTQGEEDGWSRSDEDVEPRTRGAAPPRAARPSTADG